MWAQLRDKSAQLNLIVSLVFFFGGLLIVFAGKPEILTAHRFSQFVIGLWIAQWMVFVFIYGIVIRYPRGQRWLLGLVDLQSILTIAAALILLQGEQFDGFAVAMFSGIVYVFLVLLNLFLDPWNRKKPELWRRLLWIGLSETLASLSMPLLGLALLMRYHLYGSLFLFSAVIYGGFQRAVYSSTLVSAPDMSKAFQGTTNIYFSLAIGKLALGAMFYGLFFFTLPDYPNVVPPLSALAEQAIRNKIGQAAVWALGTLLVPILVAILINWAEGSHEKKSGKQVNGAVAELDDQAKN